MSVRAFAVGFVLGRRVPRTLTLLAALLIAFWMEPPTSRILWGLVGGLTGGLLLELVVDLRNARATKVRDWPGCGGGQR